MQEITREEWGNKCLKILRSRFKEAGYDAPDDVKISVSHLAGSRGTKSRTIGQCHPRVASSAGINEICLSYSLGSKTDKPEDINNNTLEVCKVTTHEYAHAILDCKGGHGPEFKKVMLAVGMVGPMRECHASPELLEYFQTEIIDKIGQFPHRALTNMGKKQGTRMLKVTCANAELMECEFQFYTSRKQINNIGWTECHGCGENGLIVHANGEQYPIR